MVLLALEICSCAVPIKEEDFYTDKGPDGAVITHFYAPDIQDISKAAWDSIREGMTCESPDAIGDIKAEIEQLCSRISCTEATNPASVLNTRGISARDVANVRRAVFDVKQALSRIR